MEQTLTQEPFLTVIAHRYKVLGCLGKGGMGIAYRVRDMLTGEVVTLKAGLPMESFTAGRLPFRAPTPHEPTHTRQPTILYEDTESGQTIDPDDRQALDDNQTVFIHVKEEGGTVETMSTETQLSVVSDDTQGPTATVFSKRTRRYTEPAERLALAQEFALLAGLRHPNIISVLDYGFDEKREPFFTMELVKEARNIVHASEKASLGVRVDFLLQTLEALRYLHRRGVIHRDLKPSNVLVSNGHVKVLDFGISLRLHEAIAHRGSIAGTFGYIAPEILLKSPASERSDIYAFGVLAAKVIFGQPPSWMGRADRSAIPGATDEQLDNLKSVIEELVSRNPEDRPGQAGEVIAMICQAMGTKAPAESVATRESFLENADFVGRAEEMAWLQSGLVQAQARSGGVVLVSGDSGVGKSRLLREMRTRALVDGFMVISGQARSDKTLPYQLWHSVIRRLVLTARPTLLELSVLKSLIDDIDLLVEADSTIPSPVAQGPEAAQGRLIGVIEDLMRRQTSPMVIILEDLQWAGAESMTVLRVLAKVLGTSQILIIGSCRTHGFDDIQAQLPNTPRLRLEPLVDAHIATLSGSILGEDGQNTSLVEMLSQETGGNPFFLIEVLRACAENTGSLAHINVNTLDQGVLAEGLSSLLAKRLDMLSDVDRALLRVAAIIGRELDMDVMRAMEPEQPWEQVLGHWHQQAMIAIEDGQWRFAHDKFRERLLVELQEMGLEARNHGRVAKAIEEVHAHRPPAGSLAYHWGKAGHQDKEAHFSALAGEQALEVGACKEAIRFLGRALELMPEDPTESADVAHRARRLIRDLFSRDTDAPPPARMMHRGRLEGLLSEAHGRFGAHSTSLQHAARALANLGQPMPSDTTAFALDALGQGALRTLQSRMPDFYARRTPPNDPRQLAAQIQTRVTETFIYTQEQMPLIWSLLRMLNLGAPAGPSPHLARAYVLAAVLTGLLQLRGLSDACASRAMEIIDIIDTPYDTIFVKLRVGICRLYVADWAMAERLLGEGLSLAQTIKDPRQSLECQVVLGLVLATQGRFEEAIGHHEDSLREGQRLGDRQVPFWSSLLLAYSHLRQRRLTQARQMLDVASEWLSEESVEADVVLYHGLRSVVCEREGHHLEAIAAARNVLTTVSKQVPVAYWTFFGIATAAETCLNLVAQPQYKRDKSLMADTRKLCKALDSFGSKVPFATGAALRCRGRLLRLEGKGRKARAKLEEAIDAGQRLGLTYDLGRAHLELAQALAPGSTGRKHAIVRAQSLLEALGSVPADVNSDDPTQIPWG